MWWILHTLKSLLILPKAELLFSSAVTHEGSVIPLPLPAILYYIRNVNY